MYVVEGKLAEDRSYCRRFSCHQRKQLAFDEPLQGRLINSAYFKPLQTIEHLFGPEIFDIATDLLEVRPRLSAPEEFTLKLLPARRTS